VAPFAAYERANGAKMGSFHLLPKVAFRVERNSIADLRATLSIAIPGFRFRTGAGGKTVA